MNKIVYVLIALVLIMTGFFVFRKLSSNRLSNPDLEKNQSKSIVGSKAPTSASAQSDRNAMPMRPSPASQYVKWEAQRRLKNGAGVHLDAEKILGHPMTPEDIGELAKHSPLLNLPPPKEHPPVTPSREVDPALHVKLKESPKPVEPE